MHTSWHFFVVAVLIIFYLYFGGWGFTNHLNVHSGGVRRGRVWGCCCWRLCQVTGDTRHMTSNTWHVTPNTTHFLYALSVCLVFGANICTLQAIPFLPCADLKKNIFTANPNIAHFFWLPGNIVFWPLETLNKTWHCQLGHSCSSLYTIASYTLVLSCIPLHTPLHPCTHMFTLAHRCETFSP